MFKIGQVLYYYPKTKQAVIELTNNLAINEQIVFKENDKELFKQVVKQLKGEYKNIDSAKSGDIIAIKVENHVSPKTEVFKVKIS